MAAKIIFFLAITIGLVALSRCYPTGAPTETCKTFSANHTGHYPQNSKSNYDIKVSPASVTSGGKSTVTIQGDTFKGFFIQAVDQSSNEIVGAFKAQNGVAQTVDCSGPGSKSAATHVNSNDKTVVNLEWQAPQSYKGQVYFRAVIVKTYSTFWNNVRSKGVTVA